MDKYSEVKKERLEPFKRALEEIYGGPGSGPNPGGGGGGDDEDVSAILKIPAVDRTEAQVTKVFKTKDKKELQGIKGRADKWLNTYKSKAGTPEHDRMLREQTVAGRLLKGMK